MTQAQKVSMGCTMLVGTNKVGQLTPDADGYYTVVLGAYGAYNSAGMFYDLASAMPLFQPGSALMRRLEKGVLRGEYKHPVKTPGMSDQDFIQRIRQIDEDRIAIHIRRLTTQAGHTDEQGRPITVVIGEIRPSGPYAQVVKDALDNPHENVYFSVRSLTMDDTIRGVKYTREIICWDYVNEGGIFNAQKYRSPALESFDEVTLTPTTLWALEDRARNEPHGMESAGLGYSELATMLGWSRDERPSIQKGVFDRW